MEVEGEKEILRRKIVRKVVFDFEEDKSKYEFRSWGFYFMKLA